MIDYKKRRKYKYNLQNDYMYNTKMILPHDMESGLLRLNKDGELFIRAGYSWDGPSGPAIDTKNFMRASLVHDALYQLMRSGHLSLGKRKEADIIMLKICREAGMSRFRSRYIYWGVRLFSRWAAESDLKQAP